MNDEIVETPVEHIVGIVAEGAMMHQIIRIAVALERIADRLDRRLPVDVMR